MSEIGCAQLHSELFRRRHSTRQSHGLFALAKHLFIRSAYEGYNWKNIGLILGNIVRKLVRRRLRSLDVLSLYVIVTLLITLHWVNCVVHDGLMFSLLYVILKCSESFTLLWTDSGDITRWKWGANHYSPQNQYFTCVDTRPTSTESVAFCSVMFIHP